MTIDEAIAHEKELAKEIYVEAMLCHANPDDGKLDDCIERSIYHERLAEWLDELKERRKCELCAELSHCFEGKRRIEKCDKFSPKSDKNPFFNFDEVLRIECEKARSKAIDDFAAEFKNEDSELRKSCDNWYEFADRIAEQLKKEVGE